VIEVITIETPSLGDRSYLATDGEVAVVVDPQRDIDRVLGEVEQRGLRVTHVLETHVHNDYVTGGHDLARRLDARYVLNADEETAFSFDGVHDGDELRTGELCLRVLHTPGHTPSHLSYVLADSEGRVVAVFTGGSMLFGSVGRTDLVLDSLTEELTRAQYRSVRRLAAELPDHAAVHPTHGFGSHCSATDASKPSSTIRDERDDNPALTAADEDDFVRELLDGLHPYPTYYAQMGPMNRAGPSAFDPTSPAPLDLDEVLRGIDAGDWVLDLRNRRAYGRSHLLGTINAEVRNDLPAYVGWLVPFDSRLVLLGDDPSTIAEAQRMLARIGYDRLRGAAHATELAWDQHPRERSLRVSSFRDLDEVDPATRVVLDVRDGWEWDSGHHPDAVHVPFHQLPERIDELTTRHPLWVYCATGARATLATSLLANTGRQVVLVDDFCLPGDVPGRETAQASAQH
jgi:hydroxyacylglutathione hydrolase